MMNVGWPNQGLGLEVAADPLQQQQQQFQHQQLAQQQQLQQQQLQQQQPTMQLPTYTLQQNKPGQKFDPTTELQLDQWVQAKRDKDFVTADSIRSDLRSRGIEPDIVRPPGHDAVIDTDVEQKLDLWVQAKRDKNFGIADSIRAELRAIGVDPDTVRPPGYDNVIEDRGGLGAQGASQQLKFDDGTEQLLDLWVAAKRNRDFVQADNIRSELRNKGVDPDTVRPPGFDAVIDATAEQELDRWVQAKRDKDFATADAIRAELRQRGIEPDILRPPGYEAQQQMSAEVENRLDLWVTAKRNKDFTTADAIRSELRAQGIDPDTARPPAREPPALQAPLAAVPLQRAGLYAPVAPASKLARAARYTAAMPALPAARGPGVVQFRPALAGIRPGGQAAGAAQRGVAAIRPLRIVSTPSSGVRPPLQYRTTPPLSTPASRLAPLRAPPTAQQREVERQLDRWVEAKRAKDFVTADEIRSRLRKIGVEPDTARPATGAASASGYGAFTTVGAIEPVAKRPRLEAKEGTVYLK
uniref:Uncharacterized protein n=1 Tax=Alexandrium monilatum TaxID=311494 RepID=A0A7S4RC45_9DINO